MTRELLPVGDFDEQETGRLVAALVVTGFVVALAACAGGSPSASVADAQTETPFDSGLPGKVASPGCDAGIVLPGRSSEERNFGSGPRSWIQYVPASHDGDDPRPLVLDFHGSGWTASERVDFVGFEALAEDGGFVLVTPQGINKRWRTSEGPGSDVAFVAELLNHLTKELSIDERRIFAAGSSNGADLILATVCRGQAQFAAIGTVSRQFHAPECEHAGAVSVVAIHGTDDPIVPYDGGRAAAGFNTNPVVEDVTGWATQAGCDPQPILATEGVNVELTRWSGCVPGVAVELHTIRGGGHFWPGGNLGVLEFDDSELAEFRALVGSTPGQPDTTRVLWEFFTEHPVPPIVTAQ